MKKLHLILTAVIIVVGVSCQNDEELIAPQTSEALGSIDVKYLAENYYEPLGDEEIVRIADAHRAMDYEQASSFIEARYQIDKEDMDAHQAALIRDLMHEVNKSVFEQTGQSYASADPAISEAAYSSLIQTEKYAGAIDQDPQDSDEASRTAAVARCLNGSWFNTKSTPWNQVLRGLLWPIRYIGRYNFKGNSEDCDYVFRSQNYNRYYRAALIRPTSTAAILALAWKGSTKNPSKEPAINSREARFEFLIGYGRVNLFYPGPNAPQRFARDTKILLGPR